MSATISEPCTNQEIGLYQPYFFKQDKAAAHLGNSHRTATPSEAKKSGVTRLFGDMAVYAPPYLMAPIYEKNDIRIQTAQGVWGCFAYLGVGAYDRHTILLKFTEVNQNDNQKEK